MHRSARLAAALIVLLPPAGMAEGERARSSADVVMAIAATGEAEVFVLFREPARTRPGNLSTRRRAIAARRVRILAAMRPGDIRVHRALSLASGFEASVTAAGLETLLAHPEVVRVDPVHHGSGGLSESVPQIRADSVHRRSNWGQGTTVAVLDTGVDPAHPDLEGSIVAEECFCSANCCPNGARRQSGPGAAFTRFVHGIHVAGTIVSKGRVAPRGVAPAAQMVAVKVLNDQNRGSLSDWVAALEWILQNRPDVQAINMSLVSDTVYSGQCDQADGFTIAFAQVIGMLRQRGTLTFAASGNGGERRATAAPACVSAAVAVGAVTKRDSVASFSDSSSAVDLVAPGAGIVSCGPGGTASVLSGTSMAAPHATAAAALLLAINPAVTADALEHALKSTNRHVTDARNGLSFPRLNALSAMNAVLNITSPVLGGGSQRTDCLLAWRFTPPEIASMRAGAVCRDGDPWCDADDVPGQCTFRLSLCFNVPDRRLPYCDTSEPIVATTLGWPRPSRARNAFDLANAHAILDALPQLPIEAPDQCSAPISFVVPTTVNSGKQWIHFSARTGGSLEALAGAGLEGAPISIDTLVDQVAASSNRVRSDNDRIRLTCLPADQ